MKKKIRQSVFETNSSSTHSICIASQPEIQLPQSIHFEFGEFGWETRTLDSVSEKASYLYTGLRANNRMQDFEDITEILSKKGIRVTAQDPKPGARSYDDGYVDHADELEEFLDGVCSDEQKLMSFLFSPLSFILTGNDNDDIDVSIDVINYPHVKYYKGN